MFHLLYSPFHLHVYTEKKINWDSFDIIWWMIVRTCSLPQSINRLQSILMIFNENLYRGWFCQKFLLSFSEAFLLSMCWHKFFISCYDSRSFINILFVNTHTNTHTRTYTIRPIFHINIHIPSKNSSIKIFVSIFFTSQLVYWNV